jgi:copper(I)-binding protein
MQVNIKYNVGDNIKKTIKFTNYETLNINIQDVEQLENVKKSMRNI